MYFLDVARLSRRLIHNGLEQVIRDAQLQSLLGKGKIVIARDDNDLRLRQQLLCLFDKRKAVHEGHVDIHQHQVRPGPGRLLQRDLAVLRQRRHLQLGVLGHHARQPPADDVLIVRNQNLIHPTPPEPAGGPSLP